MGTIYRDVVKELLSLTAASDSGSIVDLALSKVGRRAIAGAVDGASRMIRHEAIVEGSDAVMMDGEAQIDLPTQFASDTISPDSDRRISHSEESLANFNGSTGLSASTEAYWSIVQKLEKCNA